MQTKKTNPSIAVRFKGRGGRSKLIEALSNQSIIARDIQLAEVIVKKVKIVTVKKGKYLTTQGSNNNDVYFLLSGVLSIRVNDREIATRHIGDLVGEMAMVDCTALRSASIVASELSVVARLSETDFNKLASKYPEIWRRIAVVLAQRLRERNRFHQAPRSEPSVFIGSSTEGLKIAQNIYQYLSHYSCVPRLWSEDVFEASKTVIEDLVNMTKEVDFAIIILTPDDITKSRKMKKASPRDNAIFELGLFMGALGRERTYMISPKGIDIKIPTDLIGITRLIYKKYGRGSLSQKLKTIKAQIRKQIDKYGSR